MKKILAVFSILLTASLFSFEANASECRAEMQTRRGRTIDVFYGYSDYSRRDACYDARERCERALRRRQRDGRNPYASCIVQRNRRDRGNVSKTCSVYRYGKRGRYIDSYFATANGRTVRDAKRKACAKALKKCNRHVVRRQYCERAY